MTKPRVSVIEVNKSTELVKVSICGSTYTCDTKQENGILFFRFKCKWYPVGQFITENTKFL